MTLEHPLLVVERIETSPDHVLVHLLIGGRRERCEFGMSILGLVEVERVPYALACVSRAQRAVIDLVNRAHRGDAVSLPVDLSETVRQSSEPWPSRAPTAPSKDDNSASVVVTYVMRDDPVRGVTTVYLRVRDVASVVVVDERDGLLQPVRFRFEVGLHPWQLTDAESSAMLTALLAAARVR